MLDIKFIRDNAEDVQKNADLRNVKIDIQELLKLDEQLKTMTQSVDELRTQRNANAEKMKGGGKPDDALIEEGKRLKEEIAAVEEEMSSVREQYTDLMMQVPSMTHPDSPLGKDDTENVEISRFKEPTEFSFEAKDHVTLGEELDILDFETAAEVVGSGFYYLKNDGALLELALINYAMKECMDAGFKPMLTPDLARRSVLQGTGFNPRGEETQIYNIENTDLSLIATSEITAAGYYKDHVFDTGELDEPLKIVALSHCFRTEAGSYGRESKGMYRVHQFTKVEMFVYCKPEQSEEMHEHLRETEEAIMQKLEVPYRVVDICTGDLGGAAYRKYDLEAWMPFRNGWGEITSTSNVRDYQARRLNIKYKSDTGKKDFVHMLNGTAIVSSRVPIAILENFQQEDGTVNIPEALHPYMFGKTTITPAS